MFQPYSGPWNHEVAAHLLRRTIFGPTKERIQQAVDEGMEGTFQTLFSNPAPVDPPIYYDFDKWDLRNDAILELDRLVWLFKDNPNLLIEISSHTDSRGSDEYNLKLSQKRANAVVEYLIDRGVDPRMLIAKGYGESQLVNKCKNEVICSEKEHQENRRSEFKVLAIKKMNHLKTSHWKILKY